MSIANDAWIRKMALEKGMITPFEEKQVSKGKISFGVSSYGYDVRVGRHFKMFHNLNSTLVDPKHFDERSFIDHVADECIIPPNSFVLAETVERFRIPRDTLCVCLGKCVTGDTRVVDASTGEWLPISEFAGRRKTLALDRFSTRTARVTDFIPQGKKPVFRLTTKMGLEIRATANHPFRQFTGWTALEDLRPGDRIAAVRHVPVFGTTPLPEWEATLIGRRISEAQGATSGTDEMSVPRAVFTAPREAVATFLRALFAGDGEVHASADGNGAHLEYTSTSRRLVEEIRHLLLRFGIVSALRSKVSPFGTTAHRLLVTDRSTILRFADAVGFVAGSEKQVRLETEVLAGLRAQGSIESGFDTRSNEVHAVAERVARETNDEDLADLVVDGPVWDVVASIEPAGEEEVFDLTVPGVENFFANDLVVHNSTYARCGIIVNVTPLEPEWEGVITIEISNTTPLPAKIYANEGIAQILFFRAAPDGICETSYADRKGKYQSQAGLTLPKVS